MYVHNDGFLGRKCHIYSLYGVLSHSQFRTGMVSATTVVALNIVVSLQSDINPRDSSYSFDVPYKAK